MSLSNGDVKSIPIRCLIEYISVSSSQSTAVTPTETESFAIVPCNSSFKDVVRTVLDKLGYSAQDIANAKGSVQMKNWRPLDLEAVSSNPTATVEDMLGDLTTVATLKIRITSRVLSEDIKDKLLMLLLTQSSDVLSRSGCPLIMAELEKLIAGQSELTIEKKNAFYNWYTQNVRMLSKKPPVIPFSHILSTPNLSTGKVPRVRVSFDPTETEKLNKWFEIEQHPSRQQLALYLNELNAQPVRKSQKPLDLTNIMYWFKNARATSRRGRSITSDDLSDEENSDKEESSAPVLPNKNAVYMISNPLVEDRPLPDSQEVDSESDMDEDVSVTDDNEEVEYGPNGPPAAKDLTIPRASSSDVTIKQEADQSAVTSKATGVSSTSSSPKAPVMGIQQRLSYPFAYPHALPMAYLQSQMNPFYKDWTEKVQSAVAQVQASTAQQSSIPDIKNSLGKCELKCERQKRHRAFIDPVSEIPKLEQWFIKDTHPSHYVIEQICDDLNRGEFRSRYPKLSPKNIQLWFKNHRAKVKRMRVGGGAQLSPNMLSGALSPNMSM